MSPDLPQNDAATAAGAERPARLPLVIKFLLAYLAAITIFGKGPTYLGYPPLYLGEAVLFATLIWMYARMLPGAIPRRMVSAQSAVVLLFMLLGGGIAAVSFRRWGLMALRDSAIWYYAAFFFVGLYVTSMPRVADRLWQCLVVVWVASFAWVLLLRLTGGWPAIASPKIPWRDWPVLKGSTSENYQHMALGAMMIVFGLFPKRSPRLFRPLMTAVALIGAVLLFSCRGRGVKVAVLGGFLVLLAASFRSQVLPTGKVFWAVLSVLWLVAMAALLLGPSGLAELGALDRIETALRRPTVGTWNWRQMWWRNIVDAVHQENPLFGLGFGYNLDELNPTLEHRWGDAWRVRSPHNINVTVLARMGYSGLMLWIAILAGGLGRMFVRVLRGGIGAQRYTLARHKELAFWLMMLVATWINGTWGVLLEGPVLGVWFWFALGFAAGRSMGPDGLEPAPGEDDASGVGEAEPATGAT